jgi:uncharacterized iron-regulated protein
MRYLIVLLLALAGCASVNESVPPMRPIWLLGEVHDNPAGHALRLAWFDALLSRGARPALLMEMLDRSDQAAIDRLREQSPTATALIGQLRRPNAPTGWDWRFYAPFVERALQHGLPIVAVNVGRDDARLIIRDGLAAHGFEAAVPEDLLATQAQAIVKSHCGQIDLPLARRMAQAQVARDQQMARSVQQHAARGVVLLAGNGHVRTDVGVPRWLPAQVRAQSLAVGVVEQGDETRAFDERRQVPRQTRADPCAGLQIPARP